MSVFRVAGINFDHMHMGDLLRMAKSHPRVQVVGVSDEQPGLAQRVLDQIGLPQSLFQADYRKLMESTRPDLVILCPNTGSHAQWTELVAPFGSHIFVEKPFATSVAEADQMIAALEKTGKQLIINWPLRWVATHVMAKRLVDEGAIGTLLQVHYYNGNRGPLRHLADKVMVPEEIANSQKAQAWWYQKQFGGGSMLDYLGYGTTLGTWYMNGRAPVEVTSMVDQPVGLEVDEHSITVCRYDIPNSGLSKFETRWGTFSDPWINPPQPRCGFVLVGRGGTISSLDYGKSVRLQTRAQEAGVDVAADELRPPFDNPINYVIDCLETGRPIEGPLSPKIARVGQQIVDAARRSALEGRKVSLS